MVGSESPKLADPAMGLKVLGWNTLYAFSSQGVLNFLQIIVCYVCVVLMSDACRPSYSTTIGGFVGTKHETYFYIVAYACFIVTNVLLGSFIFSHASYKLMEKTIVLFLFWLVCALISLAASILLMVSITHPVPSELQIIGYTNKVASTCLGMFNALLYATSCLKAYRACKKNWFVMPYTSCE